MTERDGTDRPPASDETGARREKRGTRSRLRSYVGTAAKLYVFVCSLTFFTSFFVTVTAMID